MREWECEIRLIEQEEAGLIGNSDFYTCLPPYSPLQYSNSFENTPKCIVVVVVVFIAHFMVKILSDLRLSCLYPSLSDG